MALAYGIGGLVNVQTAAKAGSGAPTFKGQLGQFYFDISTSPYGVYVFDGLTWQLGGNELATTTVPGIVEIDEDLTAVPSTESVVPSALAAKTYSDSVVIGSPVPWSETDSGIGELATEAEAVAVTDDDVAITPLKAVQIFASPPPLGITDIFNGGGFLNIEVQDSALIKGSMNVQTGGLLTSHPLELGIDNDNAPITIGTGGERVIRIGNPTGVTSVIIESGTGDISLGTNAIAHNINIGSVIGSSSTNINARTGEVNVSTELNLTSEASKISIKGGSATDFIGSATLTSGTVTIINSNITPSDRIVLSRSSRNGSPLMGHLQYTINGGVSFTVNSYDDTAVLQTSDGSRFSYVIFRQT